MKEPHPYLRPVDLDSSFKLKNDHEEVIVEILSLDALKTAIEGVPDTSLLFHMEGRNDFAAWIRNAIGAKTLAGALEKIKMNEKRPEETRRKMVKLLDYSLDLLHEI